MTPGEIGSEGALAVETVTVLALRGGPFPQRLAGLGIACLRGSASRSDQEQHEYEERCEQGGHRCDPPETLARTLYESGPRREPGGRLTYPRPELSCNRRPRACVHV